MKTTSFLISSILVFTLILASCNGEKSDGNTENTSSESSASNDTQKVGINPILEKNKSGESAISPKDATAESNYTSEQIDSLYSSQKIDINGLDRYVNSLTAFDYIRGHEAFKTFKKFFTEHESMKQYITTKNSILVLVPTDEYLEKSARKEIAERTINAEEGSLKPLLRNHVYNILGKYIGGDFITIEDIVSKNTYRINRREDGAWYLRRKKLVGEPALVANGIVFGMDGDFFTDK